MRKVIDLQMKICKTDIANIEVDLQFRDEILKPLMGLQHIHCAAPKYLPKLRSFSQLSCDPHRVLLVILNRTILLWLF